VFSRRKMLLYSRRTECLATSFLRVRRVSSWTHLIFPSHPPYLFFPVKHDPPTTARAMTCAAMPLPPPTCAARPSPLTLRRRHRLPVQPRPAMFFHGGAPPFPAVPRASRTRLLPFGRFSLPCFLRAALPLPDAATHALVVSNQRDPWGAMAPSPPPCT
jgi:hypothetical protein